MVPHLRGALNHLNCNLDPNKYLWILKIRLQRYLKCCDVGNLSLQATFTCDEIKGLKVHCETQKRDQSQDSIALLSKSILNWKKFNQYSTEAVVCVQTGVCSRHPRCWMNLAILTLKLFTALQHVIRNFPNFCPDVFFQLPILSGFPWYIRLFRYP